MRCTRCDRPTIPQAIGVTPAGLFVFGWCVGCLESSGCEQIVVAPRVRRPSTRLTLETWTPRPTRPGRLEGALGARRRLAALVSLLLGFWGAVLLFVGLIVWWIGPQHTAGPLKSGMRVGGPALLIGGGGTTAVVGFLLWVLNSGLSATRSVRALRVVQGLAFATAVGTLLAGIAFHSPGRDPLVVGVVSAALVASFASRWIEIRRTRRPEP